VRSGGTDRVQVPRLSASGFGAGAVLPRG